MILIPGARLGHYDVTSLLGEGRVVWLFATIWAFSSELLTAGYVLDAALTCVAVLVSTADICIPSMVYRLVFGGPDAQRRPMSLQPGHSARRV